MLKRHTMPKIDAATLNNAVSIWADSFSQKKLKRMYEIMVELQKLREELTRLLKNSNMSSRGRLSRNQIPKIRVKSGCGSGSSRA
jgi:hypothetical protein